MKGFFKLSFLFFLISMAANAFAAFIDLPSNVVFTIRANSADLTAHTITLYGVKDVSWVGGKALDQFGVIPLDEYTSMMNSYHKESLYARIVDSTSPSQGSLYNPLYGITGITLSNPRLLGDDTLTYDIHCNAGKTCKTAQLNNITIFTQVRESGIKSKDEPYLSIITSDPYAGSWAFF